jgi:hypothetical protein
MRYRFFYVFFASLLFALPMAADTTYTYTGTDFTYTTSSAAYPYSTSDYIAITLDLSAPLAANTSYILDPSYATPSTLDSWTASNGVNTFSSISPGFGFIELETDPSSNIEFWEIILFYEPSSTEYGIEAINSAGEFVEMGITDDSTGNYGGESLTAGTWQETGAPVVPEPASLLLLGSGVAALLTARRRWRA